MPVRLVFTAVYKNVQDMYTVKIYTESVSQLYNEFVDAGKITNLLEEKSIETLTKTITITFLNQSAWDEYSARLDTLRSQTELNTLQLGGADISDMYLEDDTGNRTPI